MKVPEPAWACILAFLGVSLELAVLLVPGAEEVTRHDVAMAALTLIGAAAGGFKTGSGTTSNVTAPNSTVNAAAGAAATFPETK